MSEHRGALFPVLNFLIFGPFTPAVHNAPAWGMATPLIVIILETSLSMRPRVVKNFRFSFTTYLVFLGLILTN
jgi:hypothetical protein